MARLIINTNGKLTMLRVHDIGTAFGPPADKIDVEVVVTLDSEEGKAFGFQLRNDNHRPVRQGMFDLLRDGFNHNWTINIDYEIEPDRVNGVVRRVWLTK
jgi:hypothetical protein